MNTPITPIKSFEEKIGDKIKENIGDLIEPEELKKLVEKGIEQFLFTPRQVYNNYGSGSINQSLMHGLVEKHIQTEVRNAAQLWVKENPERMEQCIKTILERDVEKVVINSLSHIFSHPAQMMMENALAQFKSGGLR